MSHKFNLFATLFSFGAMSTAFASSSVSYPNPGTENAVWYKFIAKTTGPVSAYFVGSKAGFEENIRVVSNGQLLGATGLSNRYLKYGDSITFGYVLAGDTVSIFLSIPEKNAGVWSQKTQISPGFYLTPNGIYSTHYSGDASGKIPAGVYVGFEDLAFQRQAADWDYNDSEYVFTNVSMVVDK